MNITAQISPPRTPADPHRTASEREVLAEIVPLVGFIPAYGPPAVFVLGPWLFLVLVLAGPVAWLFALVVVAIVAATVLAALAAAILAAPCLLVRYLRRHRARHASISAARAVAIRSPRVAA